jgi:hypothetical protein
MLLQCPGCSHLIKQIKIIGKPEDLYCPKCNVVKIKDFKEFEIKLNEKKRFNRYQLLKKQLQNVK